MMWSLLRRLFPKPARPSLAQNLGSSVGELSRLFAQRGIEHALIGGVAMALYGSLRATVDIDLLVDSGSADDACRVLEELGFSKLERNSRFCHYVLNLLRADLLLTQGDQTRQILARAVTKRVVNTDVRVVRPEDIIGLKLQALDNDPTRTQDKADIEMLLRDQADMDMTQVRAYYRLFGREPELDVYLTRK